MCLSTIWSAPGKGLSTFVNEFSIFFHSKLNQQSLQKVKGFEYFLEPLDFKWKKKNPQQSAAYNATIISLSRRLSLLTSSALGGRDVTFKRDLSQFLASQ